jgi:hypothetical protein
MRGRLAGYQRLRLAYLWDMFYTPSELAAELGISPRQFLRVYLPFGCPCVREGKRIFIHGVSFAEWYNATYPVMSLEADEGFCLTCKKAVKIFEPILKKSGRLSYAVFKCAHCGRKISRIVERLKI